MAKAQLNFGELSGGGKQARGSITITGAKTETIDCGFKPKHLILGFNGGWVYDEDVSTTQYQYSNSTTWSTENLQNTSGKSFCLYDIVDNGFQFYNSGTYTVYLEYIAIG